MTTYDSWKTTEPERDERCSECDGDRVIVTEEVRRGELHHVTEPCPRCADIDDGEPSDRAPAIDPTGLPEAPQ